MKLNTGSSPDETLSAKSEMVPVGATEVSSALRMPCSRDRSAEVLVEPGHRLAGEIRVLVEEREGALLRGERAGREIGRALDRLQPLRGEFHRGGAAIARAAENERVGKAGDAEPDAPFRLRLLCLLLEREARDVDGVVEHAHRQRHQPLELGEIEPCIAAEGIAHQRREVDRAQEARAVRRQRLLAAIVDVKAVGVEGVDAGDLGVENRCHAVFHDGATVAVKRS